MLALLRRTDCDGSLQLQPLRDEGRPLLEHALGRDGQADVRRELHPRDVVADVLVADRDVMVSAIDLYPHDLLPLHGRDDESVHYHREMAHHVVGLGIAAQLADHRIAPAAGPVVVDHRSGVVRGVVGDVGGPAAALLYHDLCAAVLAEPELAVVLELQLPVAMGASQ